MLTVERLRELLSYDPETGQLRWRITRKKCPQGKIAGSNAKRGIDVRIDGQLYRAHRIAWALQTGEWPELGIDHANGDPTDNSWKNLRLANQSQNVANARRRSDNTTGFKGVTFEKRSQKFLAVIYRKGRRKELGKFTTAQEAHAVYWRAAQEYYQDFARKG